ncbi:MAG: hypothetical protein KCHDKBKB_01802 [Elusimicrobia bacterium]|nr:hypothetical protein [Elusimicrobiota bacterium]
MRVKPWFLIFFALGLTGCGKRFSASVDEAETAFSKHVYVDAIDAINNGLLKWKESDGTDLKGRAYEILGKSYHRLRNTDKAIEAYEQAVALSTRTVDSAMALGNLYLAKNQPELALKSYSAALQMKPKDPLVYLGLGNAYFAAKKIPEAVAQFEKVLDVSPGAREALEQLAVLKSKPQKTTTVYINKKPPLKLKTHRKSKR